MSALRPTDPRLLEMSEPRIRAGSEAGCVLVELLEPPDQAWIYLYVEEAEALIAELQQAVEEALGPVQPGYPKETAHAGV